MLTRGFALSMFLFSLTMASGQLLLTGSYPETFDSLPTSTAFQNLDGQWQDNVTLGGWYRTMVSDGTPGVENRWRVDNGGASGGSLYSYGSFGSTDRAFGFVTSSNLPTIHIGVRLVNATGNVITDLDVAFTGEQWRLDSAAAHGLDFDYRQGGSGLTEGVWTSVPELAFLSPWHSGSGTALNGNDPANRSQIAHRIGGLNWQDGEEMWFRWTGHNKPMGDQGLAIDDFQVNAVPEPASLITLSLGASMLFRRRRSK